MNQSVIFQRMKQSKDPFSESPPPESPNPNSLKGMSEDEEDNMNIELAKFPAAKFPSKNKKFPAVNPHKMAKMHSIVSQFTDEQMKRFEYFRRAKFQKAQMNRFIASIIGTNTVSSPINVAVSVITKMFVGEVVETARIIMEERKESGPIRPCHLREAYRRLKLEGKTFKRTVPRRIFR